jgi:lysophospholipase L1-like esterase
MEFRTQVAIQEPPFRIEPCEEILFVGSCFADAIGQRFREEAFPVTVNPYGVMYNPASILHTVEKWKVEREKWKEHTPNMAFLTLGTNHVYRLKETGEIVDNCEKRPAALFQEEQLSVDQCADYLRQAIDLLRSVNPDIHVVLTVSPIRYRKYGYHESQLSKATLLLAIEQLVATTPAGSLTDGQSVALRIPAGSVTYFPAYELILDELRDYRFYAADMLHPSAQAVEYIWERLVDSYFSPAAKDYLAEWRPLKQALAHKPFNPDSAEYRAFHEQTLSKLAEFKKKYPHLAL